MKSFVLQVLKIGRLPGKPGKNFGYPEKHSFTSTKNSESGHLNSLLYQILASSAVSANWTLWRCDDEFRSTALVGQLRFFCLNAYFRTGGHCLGQLDPSSGKKLWGGNLDTAIARKELSIIPVNMRILASNCRRYLLLSVLDTCF